MFNKLLLIKSHNIESLHQQYSSSILAIFKQHIQVHVSHIHTFHQISPMHIIIKSHSQVWHVSQISSACNVLDISTCIWYQVFGFRDNYYWVIHPSSWLFGYNQIYYYRFIPLSSWFSSLYNLHHYIIYNPSSSLYNLHHYIIYPKTSFGIHSQPIIII